MTAEPLVSLREVAADFNAGRCQLRTEVDVRIGDDSTCWELVLDTEWVVYGPDGRPTYSLVLCRSDLEIGEGEPPPEALWGSGPRDMETVLRVFGIDPDARVWRKGSMYSAEPPRPTSD
jgi:hypothetical protein